MTLAAYSAPPNIATDHSGWRTWRFRRQVQFEQNCPLERGTTYYFSQSGDDTTGDGSEVRPWKTLAKIQAIHDAAPTNANTRFRLKRGDQWRETTGITLSKNNITIDDYGTGEKPFLNRFTRDYLDASNVWTNAANNRYTVAETSDIAMVRFKSDRLGATAGFTLARASSSANCEATSNSFFWGSNVLHINLGGTDPNTVDLEAVISNQVSGIKVTGDGCRIQNIRADGWGIDRAAAATQEQPFTSSASGDNANLFIGLEGYFSGSHLIAHVVGGGAGGRLMCIDCKAGLGTFVTGGATIFNTYARDGGQETWFLDCEATYGTFRSHDWSYATQVASGFGVYGHTFSADDDQELLVVQNLSIPASHTPCAIAGTAVSFPDPSDVTDFTQHRNFWVGVDQATLSSTPNTDRLGSGDNQIYYGCRLRWKMPAAGQATTVRQVNAWFINSYIESDHATVANTPCGFYNSTQSNTSHWLNTLIKIINGTATSIRRFGIDYDVRADDAGVPGAGTSSGSTMRNCIVSYSNTGGGGLYLGLTNQAASLNNNAFFGVTAANDIERGHNLATASQSLASAAVLGMSQSQLLGNGSSVIPLSHDINGKRRLASTPDIGPVDFSSPIIPDEAERFGPSISVRVPIRFPPNRIPPVLQLTGAV